VYPGIVSRKALYFGELLFHTMLCIILHRSRSFANAKLPTTPRNLRQPIPIDFLEQKCKSFETNPSKKSTGRLLFSDNPAQFNFTICLRTQPGRLVFSDNPLQSTLSKWFSKKSTGRFLFCKTTQPNLLSRRTQHQTIQPNWLSWYASQRTRLF
jgi:hypothetical protein